MAKYPEFKQRVLDAVPADSKATVRVIHQNIGGARAHIGPCYQMLYDLARSGDITGDRWLGYRRVRRGVQ